MTTKKAIEFIEHEEYGKTNELSFKLLKKNKVKKFLEINDLLLEKNYAPALLIRGYYHMLDDENKKSGDHGEKYFNAYLEKRPDSICAKSHKVFLDQTVIKNKMSIEMFDDILNNYSESQYSDEVIPPVPRQHICEVKLLYLFEKKIGGIESYADYVLKEYPDSTIAMEIKARLLLNNNKSQEALNMIKKYLKKETSIDSILIKGEAHFNLKEYEKAISCFDIGIRAIEFEDKQYGIEWRYKKIVSLIQLERYDEAMIYLNITLEMIRELEVYMDLNENGIGLLDKCESLKEELLNKGVADVKYPGFKFSTGKLAIILLVLDILLYFTLANNIVNIIITALFLITIATHIVKTYYEVYIKWKK